MIEIRPLKELDATFSAPPSKAYTLRALFIAALADGKSILRRALFADDQKHAMNALKQFGAKIDFNGADFAVDGTGGRLSVPEKRVFVGNSGVTARFLASFAAIAPGKSIISGDARMQQRPIKDLLDALLPLGINSRCINGNDCPPFEVEGGNFLGGETTVSAEMSSQYPSSILISAPYAKSDVSVKIAGLLRSKPYLDLTLASMNSFGAKVKNNSYREFIVKAGQRYKGREYVIEGDYSSASYFFTAAAITRGRVTVKNLNQDSIQGDKHYLKILGEMGCKVCFGKEAVSLEGAELNAVEADMGNYPDMVPNLAVAAAFAKGKTKIYNISHLRIKESDRIKVPAECLKKMGINAVEHVNSIEIEGGTPKGAAINSHDDHRIAMSFAVAGLAVKGMKIIGEETVAKSFPAFFDELKKIGGLK